MTDGVERIAVLEQKVEYISTRNDLQDAKIEQLNKDLIDGLKAQENLLREMVSEMKNQHQDMQIAYARMSAFTKGVLWLGGLGAATVAFFVRYGDKVKDFFM